MSTLTKILASAVFLALTGCAGFGGGADQAQRQPSDFEDIVLEPTQFQSGFLRDGMFVPAEELVQVAPGITQEEVRSLLGAPVTGSTDNWWFYNINLPLEGLDDYLVCQYRVTLQNSRVTAIDWRRPQCSARYEALVAAIPAPVEVDEPQRISLSSDILFDYKSASLSSTGERELDNVAYVILEEVDLIRLDVVGHADRIGGDAYNLELSEQRARVVGNYLQAKGIPADVINIEGRGLREPVVVCEGTERTEELKRCLQPNRRVDITIHGMR